MLWDAFNGPQGEIERWGVKHTQHGLFIGSGGAISATGSGTQKTGGCERYEPTWTISYRDSKAIGLARYCIKIEKNRAYGAEVKTHLLALPRSHCVAKECGGNDSINWAGLGDRITWREARKPSAGRAAARGFGAASKAGRGFPTTTTPRRTTLIWIDLLFWLTETSLRGGNQGNCNRSWWSVMP